MAEIVNLRQARKERARSESRARGAENAARSGRSKALKALEAARAGKDGAGHDAHRREKSGADEGAEDGCPEGDSREGDGA